MASDWHKSLGDQVIIFLGLLGQTINYAKKISAYWKYPEMIYLLADEFFVQRIAFREGLTTAISLLECLLDPNGIFVRMGQTAEKIERRRAEASRYKPEF